MLQLDLNLNFGVPSSLNHRGNKYSLPLTFLVFNSVYLLPDALFTPNCIHGLSQEAIQFPQLVFISNKFPVAEVLYQEPQIHFCNLVRAFIS